MGKEWSDLVREVADAMGCGEATQARDLALALGGVERPFPVDGETPLSSLWKPFLGLLHRRGYFVASERVIQGALQEILEMGPGFDLYDLAAALARCDVLQARRFRAADARVFPELRGFAPGEADPSTPAA